MKADRARIKGLPVAPDIYIKFFDVFPIMKELLYCILVVQENTIFLYFSTSHLLALLC